MKGTNEREEMSQKPGEKRKEKKWRVSERRGREKHVQKGKEI